MVSGNVVKELHDFQATRDVPKRALILALVLAVLALTSGSVAFQAAWEDVVYVSVTEDENCSIKTPVDYLISLDVAEMRDGPATGTLSVLYLYRGRSSCLADFTGGPQSLRQRVKKVVEFSALPCSFAAGAPVQFRFTLKTDLELRNVAQRSTDEYTPTMHLSLVVSYRPAATDDTRMNFTCDDLAPGSVVQTAVIGPSGPLQHRFHLANGTVVTEPNYLFTLDLSPDAPSLCERFAQRASPFDCVRTKGSGHFVQAATAFWTSFGTVTSLAIVFWKLCILLGMWCRKQ
jgi:hypothetical protein